MVRCGSCVANSTLSILSMFCDGSWAWFVSAQSTTCLEVNTAKSCLARIDRSVGASSLASLRQLAECLQEQCEKVLDMLQVAQLSWLMLMQQCCLFQRRQ